MVASLDTDQTQERKASERRRIGFLSELRRFNVALSRYENQFFVIGNDSFLRHCVLPDEKHISDFIRLLDDWCNKGATEKVVIATLRNRLILKCMRYIWN